MKFKTGSKDKLLKINDDKIIIVIFITLFAISIVANSILGDSISLIINLCLRISDFSNLSLSVGDNEKNAISEPDTKPEQINNKTHNRKLISSDSKTIKYF